MQSIASRIACYSVSTFPCDGLVFFAMFDALLINHYEIAGNKSEEKRRWQKKRNDEKFGKMEWIAKRKQIMTTD